MPDDHPGLAEEYEQVQHPTRWVIAHFDWFSDEYTALGLADGEAEARALVPEMARRAGAEVGELVVVGPRGR